MGKGDKWMMGMASTGKVDPWYERGNNPPNTMYKGVRVYVYKKTRFESNGYSKKGSKATIVGQSRNKEQFIVKWDDVENQRGDLAYKDELKILTGELKRKEDMNEVIKRVVNELTGG